MTKLNYGEYTDLAALAKKALPDNNIFRAWQFYEDRPATDHHALVGGIMVGIFMTNVHGDILETVGAVELIVQRLRYSEYSIARDLLTVKLIAFTDSLPALAAMPDLIVGLASFNDNPPKSMDDVKALLVKLGYTDRDAQKRTDRNVL